MKVAEIVTLFDSFAPLQYQENYDNSGLQIGDPTAEIRGALLCLDVTEEVLDEAIAEDCNLIIAHHPVIFSGIKQLTGKNYVQRVVRKAIQYNLNILVAHTNLDNMRQGVNERIARKLGLRDLRVLSPSGANLYKLIVYVPDTHADSLREALFTAGAGRIGVYADCSFSTSGQGTFRAENGANPFIGQAGGARETVAEQKIEVLVPVHLRSIVQGAMLSAHPYEEVAHEWFVLQNPNPEIGAGMIGELPEAMDEQFFLDFLKENMKVSLVRHTAFLQKKVYNIAVCGGSGSFLLSEAISQKADVFVSADFKYHQFFDAEGKILITDIGHYETEQFTVEIFNDILRKKNVTFAVLLSTVDTNPIKYY